MTLEIIYFDMAIYDNAEVKFKGWNILWKN